MIIRGNKRPAPSLYTGSGSSRTRKQIAQKKAISRARDQYFPLICGHYGNIDTTIAYELWRPKDARGKHYCFNCGKWRALMPKSKPVNLYPDISLF